MKPYVPLLRVKDNELYGAIYCGVCRSLANCFGRVSSVSLSFDVTFLACVRLALSKESFTVSRKRCSFNPMKRCKIASNSEELDFCAAVGILLTYYKLIDTKNDEGTVKKIAASMAMPLASSKRRRVIKKYGDDADKIIKEGIDALTTIETEGRKSIDEPSDVFGKMLGRLASFGLEGFEETVARHIGECIGKWIYIADAMDDCEQDIEKKRYNPIASLYGRAPTEEEYNLLSLTLGSTLERLSAAIDLIDYPEDDGVIGDGSVTAYFSDELRSVIENTVSIGMPEACKKILASKNFDPVGTDAD